MRINKHTESIDKKSFIIYIQNRVINIDITLYTYYSTKLS